MGIPTTKSIEKSQDALCNNKMERVYFVMIKRSKML